MDTSVAYTADCVPPSPIQTSLYRLDGSLDWLMESICDFSFSVNPKRDCIWSKRFINFRWSSSILQSELLMMLSFTMGDEMMSSTSCVTTIASPKYFLTVLYI